MSIDEREHRLAALRARSLTAARAQFDPQRHLIAQPAAHDPTVRTYRQAASLPLAYALLAEEDPASVEEGIAIVSAVLESQETDPSHRHHGNWLWLADDHEVGDLNAVQFVLRGLMPVLIDHGDKLPDDLLERCRQSVSIALAEEERIDVAPTYTNIHIMSLFGLLVGAEWLSAPLGPQAWGERSASQTGEPGFVSPRIGCQGTEHFLRLGKERWQRWARFTIKSGAPHEYNSPGYGGVDLSALVALCCYVQDPAIRLQAKLIYERFWLHLALHIHRPTGQLVGPHCRSYWWQMITGHGPIMDALWRETGWTWPLRPGPYGGKDALPDDLELSLAGHQIPLYLIPWFERQGQALPYEVRESANVAEGYDLTTYHTSSYALGTASNTYAIGTDCYYIEHHANYLMLHYTRPETKGGRGMVYSRYVVNDRHWGTMGAAPDRSKDSNFYDHGHFAGVQQRNKAIGLYALQPQHDEVFSLKTIVAFQSGPDLERVWINDEPVDLAETRQTLAHEDWLIVEDGDVYVGLRALEQTALGKDAPIVLERGPLGELWLAIYNYRGAPIRFWDFASLKGAFWRGNLRAGFVIEVAERHEYAMNSNFLAHLCSAQIADNVNENHVRTVTYSSGNESITLDYDLWHTRPVGRRFAGQAYVPPNLASPLAVQGDSGFLQVGEARLYTDPQQVWLIAQEVDPTAQTYVAVNPFDRPTPLRLETPAGVVTASAWGMGRIEWRMLEDDEQVVTVEGLESPDDLIAPHGVRIVSKQV